MAILHKFSRNGKRLHPSKLPTRQPDIDSLQDVRKAGEECDNGAHGEYNHLLNDLQRGFVPGRSCSAQVFLQFWMSGPVPLKRVTTYMRGPVLQWIEALLSDRRQWK